MNPTRSQQKLTSQFYEAIFDTASDMAEQSASPDAQCAMLHALLGVSATYLAMFLIAKPGDEKETVETFVALFGDAVRQGLTDIPAVMGGVQ